MCFLCSPRDWSAARSGKWSDILAASDKVFQKLCLSCWVWMCLLVSIAAIHALTFSKTVSTIIPDVCVCFLPVENVMLWEVRTLESSVLSRNVYYVPGLCPVLHYSVKGQQGITPRDTLAHRELVPLGETDNKWISKPMSYILRTDRIRGQIVMQGDLKEGFHNFLWWVPFEQRPEGVNCFSHERRQVNHHEQQDWPEAGGNDRLGFNPALSDSCLV